MLYSERKWYVTLCTKSNCTLNNHCIEYTRSVSMQRREFTWRNKMNTFSALLALCEGNPPVTGGFPSQRPVTQSFDAFLSKQTVEQTNRDAGNLRCGRAHYNVTAMQLYCEKIHVHHMILHHDEYTDWNCAWIFIQIRCTFAYMIRPDDSYMCQWNRSPSTQINAQFSPNVSNVVPTLMR